MGKIIKLNQVEGVIKKIKAAGKTTVLAGGCFDLLHFGHVKYLEAAKKEGDILVVALEFDDNVKRLKGPNRPINSQENRAKLLSAISFVDFVLLLPLMKTDQDYLSLVKKIKPEVIALTAGDPFEQKVRKEAKIVGATVKIVIKRLKDYSTSKLEDAIKSNPTPLDLSLSKAKTEKWRV